MTNTTLTLLAAGSLRSAFLPLVAHFRQHTGLAVDAQFGPAGLLRERIEAGSPCAVFASANAAHPQALLQAGLAQECQGFASNQLMLTARRSPDNDGLDWLALLNFEVLHYGRYQVLPWSRHGGKLLSTHLPALGCLQLIVARKRTIPLTLNPMKSGKAKTQLRPAVGATRQWRKGQN